jgi:amino acid efflux transporter
MLSLVISVVFFAILFVQDFQLLSLIPIHLSSMVAIYVLGMAAAVLIFPRWSFDWWIAVIALAMTILLLVLNGPNVLFPATVVIVSLGVTLVKRRLKAQKARQSR